MQRGLLPGANFRGSDPRSLERVFSLSPGCGPLYGDGFEALSLESLLRSSGELPVVPCLNEMVFIAGGEQAGPPEQAVLDEAAQTAQQPHSQQGKHVFLVIQ